MAHFGIEEFNDDLKELDSLISQAKRPRIIEKLANLRKTVATEVNALREKEEQSKITRSETSSATQSTPRRFEFELTNYAWDQSDKFIKIFLALDGVQNTTEENVIVEFTDKSISSTITGVDNKDFKFAVKSLLYAINPSKSYRKIKTNAIVIYAKKEEESKKWSHLTATEKRLADMKSSALTDLDTDGDKSDPTSGLMNMMRKMYDTGDPEMKKMIAKAWTEGQENNLKNNLQ